MEVSVGDIFRYNFTTDHKPNYIYVVRTSAKNVWAVKIDGCYYGGDIIPNMHNDIQKMVEKYGIERWKINEISGDAVLTKDGIYAWKYDGMVNEKNVSKGNSLFESIMNESEEQGYSVQVGDILTYDIGATMTLPHFVRIVKRSASLHGIMNYRQRQFHLKDMVKERWFLMRIMNLTRRLKYSVEKFVRHIVGINLNVSK